MDSSNDWPPGYRANMQSGFSLLEIMVALLVLVIVSLILVSVLDNTQQGTQRSERHVDAAAQAAFVFDVIGRDLAAMPIRKDLPSRFGSGIGAAEQMLFLSGIEGMGGERELSVVAYRVGPLTGISGAPPGAPVLQRATLGLDWDAVGYVGRKGTMDAPTPITVDDWPVVVAAADYDMLADGVVRMEVAFHLSEQAGPDPAGSIIAAPPEDSAGNPDFSKIGAISVILAVIDLRSRAILDPADLDAVAASFPEPENGVLPNAAWQQIASDPANFQGIPQSAAQSVRVFQQTFPIDQP